MPPNLRLRPFRSKGDVKRMMQRLFGTAARDLEAFDPVTLGAFLAKADGFPGAFASYLPLNVTVPLRWFWYEDPASSLINGPPGTELHEKFWHPGQSILPPSTGQVPERILTGWYFEASSITLRFYTTGDVAKAGLVQILRSNAAYLPERTPGTITADDAFILGQAIASGTDQIQHFDRSPTVATGTGSTVHGLYCVAMIPGQHIELNGFTGLITGDNVALNMCGRWRFSPRFIDASEERNG